MNLQPLRFPGLSTLRDATLSCTSCALRSTCNGPVPGQFPSPDTARSPSRPFRRPIMLVGEAPGKDEDLGGRPFI